MLLELIFVIVSVYVFVFVVLIFLIWIGILSSVGKFVGVGDKIISLLLVVFVLIVKFFGCVCIVFVLISWLRKFVLMKFEKVLLID